MRWIQLLLAEVRDVIACFISCGFALVWASDFPESGCCKAQQKVGGSSFTRDLQINTIRYGSNDCRRVDPQTAHTVRPLRPYRAENLHSIFLLLLSIIPTPMLTF